MRYILIVAISFFALAANAQKKDKKRHRANIEAKKIGYITDKLELTADEAQKFWPVYNEYSDRMDEVREQGKKPKKDKKETFTEQEANEMLNSMIAREEKTLAIKKEYIGKLKNVIPTEKVAKLMIVERRFREEMMRAVKKRFEKRKTKRDQKGRDKIE